MEVATFSLEAVMQSQTGHDCFFLIWLRTFKCNDCDINVNIKSLYTFIIVFTIYRIFLLIITDNYIVFYTTVFYFFNS